MVAKLCLLACAVAVGQPPDRADWLLAPKLSPGLELVYAGTYREEVLVPGVQFERNYKLESTILVLEETPRYWNVAIMTVLGLEQKRRADGQDSPSTPSSVRLELAQVDKQGKARSSGGSLAVALAGPPTIECGAILPLPTTRLGRYQMWEVAEEGRPPQTWQVQGSEPCNGGVCLRIHGQQQSDDWAWSRADRTAWKRFDSMWLSPHLGVAVKVERTIERRDPARSEPTQRLTVRYELRDPLKYSGKFFWDRRQEITLAHKLQQDSAAFLERPADFGPQIDGLLHKIAFHLKQPPTPYRPALEQVQRRLESARRGELPAQAPDDRPSSSPAVTVGQRVPDFVVSELSSQRTARLYRQLGRPILIIFYSPTSDSGLTVLRFAQSVQERFGPNVAIMAMAVTQQADVARKQHADLRLPFPVLDGTGLRLTFAVEATPRVVVLDDEGYLRAAYTGWGSHLPREITAELERWLPQRTAPFAN